MALPYTLPPIIVFITQSSSSSALTPRGRNHFSCPERLLALPDLQNRNKNKFHYFRVHSTLDVVFSPHKQALLYGSRYAHILTISTKKNQLHFFRFSRKHSKRQETLCTPQDEKFCQCSDDAPLYKNCRRVATVVVVAAAALRGRRQQRSVTFATYLSLPRV